MSTANERCIQTAYASDGDTSSDVELWYVQVPAVDYVRQAFVGALANLGFSTSYNPINDQAAEYGSLIIESLTQIIPPEEVSVPASSELNLFPATATVINGNALALIFNAAQRFGNWFQQNTPAVNDRFQWTRFMSAGDWNFRVTAVKRSSCGILTFTIKDVAETTVYYSATTDLYNASDIFNFAITNSVALPATGEYVIIVSVASKNGSASTYTIPVSCIEMWRTN